MDKVELRFCKNYSRTVQEGFLPLGRQWLETGQGDGEVYLKEWILYDPLSARLVTRAPAIFASGSGDSAVSAGSTLWVRTLDASGLVPYAYAFKP